MNSKSKIIWIARAAVFVALLIAVQTTDTSLGDIILTGSIVNRDCG